MIKFIKEDFGNAPDSNNDNIDMERFLNFKSVLLSIIEKNDADPESTFKINITELEEIRNKLNELFMGVAICGKVVYTINTDKPFFGVYVNPDISHSDAGAIMFTDEKVKLSAYTLELDSKLFYGELDETEIASIIIHDVASIMDSYSIIDKIREKIDIKMISDNETFLIRNSLAYSGLMSFAIKDTLIKLGSIFYDESDSVNVENVYIIHYDLQSTVLEAKNKIVSSIYGKGDIIKTAETSVLYWVLTMYTDIKANARSMTETLEESKLFTGSRLEIKNIDNAIADIDTINTSVMFNESGDICKVLEESRCGILVTETSLFAGLKKNGLRNIEDSLYEYSIRAKNTDTEEDAMYLIRSINTRLNILQDYIYNTPNLNDNERKHWEAVIAKYMALRDQVVKKTIYNKKQYGIFFDYNKLDYMDKEN